MVSIQEIKSGSESAFTLVYNQFHKQLYGYFLKKTNSAETAKELVQVSFIKLWNAKHTLQERYTLNIQLFTIARTTFIDYLKQQATSKFRMINGSEDICQFSESISAIQDNTFEISDYLGLAMQSLSPARKKIFVLSRIHGLTYKEIAEKLSISVKTVEDHISKALRQIRSISSLFFFLVLQLFFSSLF